MDQEEKILSFLTRCQNGSSEASNIARYLGFSYAKNVLPLLRQMESEGILTRTGYKWQVSRSRSPPNGSNTGDSQVVVPAASASQPPVRAVTRAHGRHRCTEPTSPDNVAASPRRSSLPTEQSRRHSDETNGAHRTGDENAQSTTRQSKTSDYKFVQLVGQGGYGCVFEVERKTMDKHSYALKVVKLLDSEDVRQRVTREVEVMASLNHPNIVRYYDSWFDVWSLDSSQIDSLFPIGRSVDSGVTLRQLTPNSSSSQSHPPASNLTDSVTYLYIRMELLSTGTLENWLDKHREHRPVEVCVKIFKSVVKAIDYLHGKNFMHRDIKPQNILFDERSGNVKVSDFGLATVINGDKVDFSFTGSQSDPVQRTVNKGTQRYMSPEQKAADTYDNKVDIYALGLVMVEILSPCKTERERSQLFQNMRNSQVTLPVKFMRDFPDQIRFVKSMLSHNPSQRPTTEEILVALKQMQPRTPSPANTT